MRRWAIDFDSLTVCKAAFIKPMECLSVSKLPEGKQWVGKQWVDEVKFDGYRAVGGKVDLNLTLYSRRERVLNKQFPHIVAALRELPPGTVVDGEIVALDDAGRPTFSLLQNFRSDPSKAVATSGLSWFGNPENSNLRGCIAKVHPLLRCSACCRAAPDDAAWEHRLLGLRWRNLATTNGSHDHFPRT